LRSAMEALLLLSRVRLMSGLQSGSLRGHDTFQARQLADMFEQKVPEKGVGGFPS